MIQITILLLYSSAEFQLMADTQDLQIMEVI